MSQKVDVKVCCHFQIGKVSTIKPFESRHLNSELYLSNRPIKKLRIRLYFNHQLDVRPFYDLS